MPTGFSTAIHGSGDARSAAETAASTAVDRLDADRVDFCQVFCSSTYDPEAVFERGYSTAESGTGLGLSIVDTIAGAHGWEVEVTESWAGGARFEFRW